MCNSAREEKKDPKQNHLDIYLSVIHDVMACFRHSFEWVATISHYSNISSEIRGVGGAEGEVLRLDETPKRIGHQQNLD